MIKLIYSDQLPNDLDARVTMIEDPDRFVKKAAESFDLSSVAVRPPKGYVGIHTVALGDWETYGMNRNGDAFTKEACRKYHPTFVKHGHVFRNHDNKDPKNAIGKIAASVYNEPMGRIELVIWANEKKAAPELHKLAKDGTIPFSMACFLAGTPILTKTGFKPVEKIENGDVVLTHLGRWKPVTATMCRTSSDYYDLSFVSWGSRHLRLTGEHPVLAASFDDLGRRYVKGCTKHPGSQWRRAHRPLLASVVKWKKASELTSYDYLCVPIPKPVGVVSDKQIRLARLFGYYIAEGSVSGHGTNLSMQLTCNVSDCFIDEIETLADWVSVSRRPHPLSNKAVVLDCFGKPIVDNVLASCGRRCENKHIPASIRFGTYEEKFNFVSAWFNGDGWQDKTGMHWSMKPEGLALDLQVLLASIHLPSSCTKIDHPEIRGSVRSKNATEYVVTVSNEYSELFAGISKASCRSIFGSSKSRTFISGNYLMVPVKCVKHVNKAAEVYNFSVADDESYTALGFAVHNCKVPNDRCTVCGAIRKNAMDPKMCKHVRDDLGKIASDGTAIGTFNDQPTWFDESFVHRPADRIAWDLGKVASVGTGGEPSSIEYAKMAHIYVPESVYADSTPGYSRKSRIFEKLAFYERAYFDCSVNGIKTASDLPFINLMAAASIDVSPSFLSRMRALPCTGFLKAASDAGVVFSAPVFFKYAFGRDFGQVADKMADVLNISKNGLFNQLKKEGMFREICSDTYFDVGNANACDLPYDFGMQLKQAFSVEDPYASSRAISHSASNYPLGSIRFVKFASHESPEAVKLAASYAAYVLSSLDNICKSGTVGNDKILALSAVQNLLL